MEGQTTTPLILLGQARDFVSAGISVRRENQGRVFFPGYFLIARSIELSLKAFLLGRGIPISVLRSRKYGHNLEALLVEARKRKLGSEVKLTNIDIGVIRLLNFDYSSKRLEYLEKGGYYLPDSDKSEKVANKLAHGLKGFCSRKTLERFK